MNKTAMAMSGALLVLGTLSGRAQMAWQTSGWDDESDSYLGVYLKEVSPDTVKELDLPAERGAICAEVIPDSPADQAGLQENDVIVEWNDTAVEGTRQLQRLVRETPAGRAVTVQVVRGGDTTSLEATVGRRQSPAMTYPQPSDGWPNALGPWHPPVTSPPDQPSQLFGPSRPRLGIAMQALTDQLAGFFGLAADQEGVLVASVLPNSAAEKAGVQAGDVITEIDGDAVAAPGDVQDKIMRAAGLTDLTIVRDRSVMHLEVSLSDTDQSTASAAAPDGGDELHDEITFPRGSM